MPVLDVLGGQLELQGAVSCVIWGLGTASSSRAASFLKPLSQLSSPVLFLKQGFSYAQKLYLTIYFLPFLFAKDFLGNLYLT